MGGDELIHFGSAVRVLTDPNSSRSVVEVMFAATQGIQSRILMDKATAAKLINQLRRELDNDWNRNNEEGA